MALTSGEMVRDYPVEIVLAAARTKNIPSHSGYGQSGPGHKCEGAGKPPSEVIHQAGRNRVVGLCSGGCGEMYHFNFGHASPDKGGYTTPVDDEIA